MKHKEHTVQNHYVCMQVEEEVEVELGDEGGVVVSGDVVFRQYLLTA